MLGHNYNKLVCEWSWFMDNAIQAGMNINTSRL